MVAPPVAAAKRLIDSLDGALNVTAAFWIYWPTSGTWRLYIAVSEVTTRGPHAVYDIVQEAIRKSETAHELSTRDVYLLSPHDSLVHAVRAAAGRPVLNGEVQLPRVETGENEYDVVIVLRVYTTIDEAFEAAVLDRLAEGLRELNGHVVPEATIRTRSGALVAADLLAIFDHTHLLVECKYITRPEAAPKRLREAMLQLSRMVEGYRETVRANVSEVKVRGVLVVPADVRGGEVAEPNILVAKFDLARRDFVEPSIQQVLAA